MQRAAHKQGKRHNETMQNSQMYGNAIYFIRILFIRVGVGIQNSKVEIEASTKLVQPTTTTTTSNRKIRFTIKAPQTKREWCFFPSRIVTVHVCVFAWASFFFFFSVSSSTPFSELSHCISISFSFFSFSLSVCSHLFSWLLSTLKWENFSISTYCYVYLFSCLVRAVCL